MAILCETQDNLVEYVVQYALFGTGQPLNVIFYKILNLVSIGAFPVMRHRKMLISQKIKFSQRVLKIETSDSDKNLKNSCTYHGHNCVANLHAFGQVKS